MKILSLLAGLLLMISQPKAPNYIGMSKDDIKETMQKLNSGFDFDEGAKNDTYKYLKYVDKYNEETWLFFLTVDDACFKSKLMSDYSNLKNRVDELDKTYKNAGEDKWVYLEKGVTYFVELKKEEWFFTIVTYKKK